MANLFRRLFGAGRADPEHSDTVPPLKGRRPVRRLKMYTALSGYVYEYVHEGYRDHADAREHVFAVSGDRKTWFTLSVSVPAESVQHWQQTRGRTLNDAERYAVAKLALFDAFDVRPSPTEMREAIHVDAAAITRLLDSIDL